MRQERKMKSPVKSIVESCSADSDAERVSFGEVVRRLMEAGVERYHADLERDEKTYYMPDGSSHVVANAAIAGSKAAQFSADGVEASVRAIQGDSIKYREFCSRIAAAGCVGYFVSLAGRRAVYYGRTGESHVEYFPGSR
jgi:uncharacterized protein YbcV (DUF1398 family)